jgi:OOP family OmpA-OmpF porin
MQLTNTDNKRKTLLGKISALENVASNQTRKIAALSASTIELDALKSAYKDLSSKKVELSSKLTVATADTDGDGVLDNADKCPNSATGTEVNGLGCLADMDKDGVVDSKDNCPTSPTGSSVNTEGCPNVVDTDGDTVADSADLCPNTPADMKVNEFGCKPTENITLKGVNFATGSARLTPNSIPILTAAAATLNQNPSLKIEISGYTDNQGLRYINKRLSQRRANTVMIQLIKDGVDANRLAAKGYGEKNPITSNRTAKGRSTNRRVELKIRK